MDTNGKCPKTMSPLPGILSGWCRSTGLCSSACLSVYIHDDDRNDGRITDTIKTNAEREREKIQRALDNFNETTG